MCLFYCLWYYSVHFDYISLKSGSEIMQIIRFLFCFCTGGEAVKGCSNLLCVFSPPFYCQIEQCIYSVADKSLKHASDLWVILMGLCRKSSI